MSEKNAKRKARLEPESRCAAVISRTSPDRHAKGAGAGRAGDLGSPDVRSRSPDADQGRARERRRRSIAEADKRSTAGQDGFADEGQARGTHAAHEPCTDGGGAVHSRESWRWASAAACLQPRRRSPCPESRSRRFPPRARRRRRRARRRPLRNRRPPQRHRRPQPVRRRRRPPRPRPSRAPTTGRRIPRRPTPRHLRPRLRPCRRGPRPPTRRRRSGRPKARRRGSARRAPALPSSTSSPPVRCRLARSLDPRTAQATDSARSSSGAAPRCARTSPAYTASIRRTSC